MKKILYWIWYQALKLYAKITKSPLKYIGRDYFILWARVIELRWLYIQDCFSYKNTVMYVSWTRFIINGDTVIDIENWLEVLFYDKNIRPNVAWYVINNKQYDTNLNLIDNWELHTVIYNLIVTETEQNEWILYKILNLKWEELYRMFSDKDKLKITQQWDYMLFELGNHKKEIHIMWVVSTI